MRTSEYGYSPRLRPWPTRMVLRGQPSAGHLYLPSSPCHPTPSHRAPTTSAGTARTSGKQGSSDRRSADTAQQPLLAEGFVPDVVCLSLERAPITEQIGRAATTAALYNVEVALQVRDAP